MSALDKDIFSLVKKRIALVHVRNHTWAFMNSLMLNPTFDSQTKETMTLKATAAELAEQAASFI